MSFSSLVKDASLRKYQQRMLLGGGGGLSSSPKPIVASQHVILSFSRFERKKQACFAVFFLVRLFLTSRSLSSLYELFAAFGFVFYESRKRKKTKVLSSAAVSLVGEFKACLFSLAPALFCVFAFLRCGYFRNKSWGAGFVVVGGRVGSAL